MRRVLLTALLLAACRKSPAPTPVQPSVEPADGGPVAVVQDAGTPDAGPPPAPPDPHRIGGLGAGPWPTAPMTVYGAAQGLQAQPVAASTDEAENLWVVTHEALYLLKPGATIFKRYTAADGLHYGAGWTDPPDIVNVVGGVAGECFVGYFGHDTHNPPDPYAHTDQDPAAHLGKMDQVILKQDGTLEVRRYDFHNTNDWHYFETREVDSFVYDHFQHPGNLYVGSNHGVTRVVPAKWRQSQAPWDGIEKEYYGDHVHPVVCRGHYCVENGPYSVTFGDFFGLTLAPDGRLWMGGLTSAGALGYVEDLQAWTENWTGHNPFIPAFGDPYPGNPPVFNPPLEGDWVNIRAVTVTPDGLVWFASGEAESWRGPTYGMASWDGHLFRYYDPTALGASEYNILEMVAWPVDGRLLLGFPSSGVLVWKPGDTHGFKLQGLPGDRIGRMSLDQMVDPPQLFVPTEGGLAVIRALPK